MVTWDRRLWMQETLGGFRLQRNSEATSPVGPPLSTSEHTPGRDSLQVTWAKREGSSTTWDGAVKRNHVIITLRKPVSGHPPLVNTRATSEPQGARAFPVRKTWEFSLMTTSGHRAPLGLHLRGHLSIMFKRKITRELPCGPGVGILCSHHSGPAFNPRSEN